MTDYSAWTYKNSILIYGSPDGALTNYQVEVTIPYQSFMRSDFGDIRFTLVDGSGYSYYLESYTAFNCYISLKIPSIPRSGNNVQIHIYAGNSEVTTTSNSTTAYSLYDSLTNYVANWSSKYW